MQQILQFASKSIFNIIQYYYQANSTITVPQYERYNATNLSYAQLDDSGVIRINVSINIQQDAQLSQRPRCRVN